MKEVDQHFSAADSGQSDGVRAKVCGELDSHLPVELVVEKPNRVCASEPSFLITNEHEDGQMDRWMDRWTDGQMDRDRQTAMGRRMVGMCDIVPFC